MSSNLRKLGGLSSAFILTAAMAGCATHGELGAGSATGDAKVSSDVRALFDQHPELGAPNLIDVHTVDHVVYLNGTVSQGLQSQEAETVALQAAGVTRVVNSIAVSR
ncbi:MAG: BON domain-containing protein [Steroidobacteraceae bacterium]|jgi:osmotically-inducible protein OsmY